MVAMSQSCILRPGLAAVFVGNSRRGEFFLDACMLQVEGRASRERRWGSDGARLEYVSAFSVDPIAADNNLYRYCFNNPLIYTDPTGLGASQDKNGKWTWDTFTPNAEKCAICKATHDAYKAAGDKAGGGRTEADCGKLKEIVKNLADEIAGRQKYLDLGCDYRIWSDPPPTKSPKDMEKGHLEELDNLRRYQDKVEDRLTDPNGPCGCKK